MQGSWNFDFLGSRRRVFPFPAPPGQKTSAIALFKEGSTMRPRKNHLALLALLAGVISAPIAAQAAPTLAGAAAHYDAGAFKEARAEFETLAQAGDMQAQYFLGLMTLEGKGGPKDEAGALAWFMKSANQGNLAAVVDIAIMHDQGEGTPRDSVKAVRWYRLAADNGHAASQYNLGQHYMDGDGVEKDLIAATSWWRKAADQGDADAQFNLGAAYANGVGVSADAAEAYKWMLLSAAGGNQDALAAGAKFKAKITADQAAQGEAKAQAWKPAH